MNNQGKVVQVIGPVIDIQFDESRVPEIYNAIELNYKLEGKDTRLVLETQQHLGNGLVRAVAMSTTEGVVRGMSATDSGSPITVPVGESVLGRIFNVIGEPVDNKGPVKAESHYPIHR